MGADLSLPFYLENPGPHWYDEAHWYCLDLETTNKDHGDPRNEANRIVMAACHNGYDVKVHADLDFEWIEPRRVLVAHNAKFELGWMLRYGYDLSKFLVWDTMIAEYVLAGNRPMDLSLGATAKRYGLAGKEKVVDGMMKAGICPSEMPERWLRDRVSYDVETTMAIARKQYVLLKEAGLLPVFFTRCIATPVLAAMEFTGMRLDPERVERTYLATSFQRMLAEQDLVEQTGGINMRSRKQLAEFLYDKLEFEERRGRDGEPKRTAAGQRLTDSDTLKALKATTKPQKEFLKAQAEFASLDAKMSKSLELFHAAVQADGMVYGNFNQTVTATHRLSATAKRMVCADGKTRGAQFQNMYREFKRLFMALEDGRLLTEADYAQLEFRIAAELAGDVQALLDIQSGHDVHKFTASVLKRKPMDEVTDEERQAAKPDTFKPLYYGQSGTPRQQAYYAAFRERYPQIAAMQELWLADAVRTKRQVTASGLIYYWPGARRGRTGYVDGSPSICNYPIQAFATADIVPIGLTYAFWRLQDMDAQLINTVHDSLLVDHAEGVDVVPVLKTAMVYDVVDYISRVYGRVMTVPLAGEYITARHWADKSEAVSKGSL